MNVGLSVKNYMSGVFMKRVICGLLVRVIVSVVRYVNFSWEKCLIDKLVLRCEYKILITTEILLDDKSNIRIR